MATTSERLREIMSIRNVKQADIIEKTGINKGALSSYISGRYVPKQDNIYRLAKALDVNPAWLMGLDVPMEVVKDTPQSYVIRELYKNLPDDVQEDETALTEAIEIIRDYEELSPAKRNLFVEYLKILRSDL